MPREQSSLIGDGGRCAGEDPARPIEMLVDSGDAFVDPASPQLTLAVMGVIVGDEAVVGLYGQLAVGVEIGGATVLHSFVFLHFCLGFGNL